MNPIIQIENLSVKIETENGNSKQIIHDINLVINSKEIIGIVGPSGAGKTTLVKAIALLNYNLIHGKYKYQDSEIIPSLIGSSIQRIRKNLIFIHQHPVLFKGSVRYNLEYGLRIRKMKIDENHLGELISSFKLNDLVDRNIDTLSGGEKQRVCLLRAMVVKPKVLILDEPTQNLDPANIKNIEKNIIKYRDQEDGTVVIVTHNLFQAQRITEKMLILINGQIVEFGNTHELFRTPKKSQSLDFLSGKVIF